MLQHQVLMQLSCWCGLFLFVVLKHEFVSVYNISAVTMDVQLQLEFHGN